MLKPSTKNSDKLHYLELFQTVLKDRFDDQEDRVGDCCEASLGKEEFQLSQTALK